MEGQTLSVYARPGLVETIEVLAKQEDRSISNMTWILLKEALDARGVSLEPAATAG